MLKKGPKDGTFMTSLGGQGSQVPLRSKLSRKSLDPDIDEAGNVASSQTIKGIDKSNLSDIDLNAEYSDEDDQIYFDNDKAVVNHLENLEENNLFKIKHLEDSEQTLEKLKQVSQLTIKERQKKIDDVSVSIEILQRSYNDLKHKRRFFETSKSAKGTDSVGG